MKLAILNTSIVTSDGTYTLESISTEEAVLFAQTAEDGLDSAVGHESTAVILSTVLGRWTGSYSPNRSASTRWYSSSTAGPNPDVS
jgi:hypothetical protein